MNRAKTIFRATAAGTLHWTGLTAWLRRMHRHDLAVLCYHRVLPEGDRAASPFSGLAVTPEVFDAQMRWLARHYRCMTLREAIEERRRRVRLDTPTAVITFDDGYRDNATFAAPILKEHGIPATFFVISALVGRDESPWYDRLARSAHRLLETNAIDSVESGGHDQALAWLRRNLANGHGPGSAVERAKSLDAGQRREVTRAAVDLALRAGPDLVVDDPRDRIMTAEQLRGLVRQGHEVGTHTRSHPILPRLTPDEIDEELSGSCAELSSITGKPIVSLAYPNGDFNEVVVSKARNAGIRQAVTTQPGLNNPHRDEMRLLRLYVAQERLVGSNDRHSDALFALELTGAADAIFLRDSRRNRRAKAESNGGGA